MSSIKLPSLVLVAPAAQSGDSWHMLTGHACGGFKRETLTAAVYLLNALPDMQDVIDDLGYEQFLSDLSKGLDHGVDAKQSSEYINYLKQDELTVSAENLSRLKQGLYPMDATEQNLLLLTGSKKIDGVDLAQCYLAVLGENCA